MNARPVFSFKSLLIGSLLAAGSAGSVMAQSSSGAQGLLDDKLVFNLGAFVYGSSLKANLNGQSTNNPEINFDDSFGKAEDATRVRADMLWRITPTHHMRLMYFDNSLTRTNTLGEDIQWGDYTFLKGSSAEFRQKFKVFELAYEYAFLRSPGYEVAATVGVHYLDLNLQLAGSAILTGPGCSAAPCTASATSKASSLPAPLPVIGLRAGWAVAPNWYLDAQGQVFKINVDGYDGNWTDLRLGATWMFSRNFGLGLGYNHFATKVDVSRNDFNGRLKLGYSGLQAYLTGTF